MSDGASRHFATGIAVSAFAAIFVQGMGMPAWGLWAAFAATAAGLADGASKSLMTGMIHPGTVFWTGAGAMPCFAFWALLGWP